MAMSEEQIKRAKLALEEFGRRFKPVSMENRGQMPEPGGVSVDMGPVEILSRNGVPTERPMMGPSSPLGMVKDAVLAAGPPAPLPAPINPLAQMEKEAAESRFAAGIGRAGARIGQAISGAPADIGYWDKAAGRGDARVDAYRELLAKRAAQAGTNDPLLDLKRQKLLTEIEKNKRPNRSPGVTPFQQYQITRDAMEDKRRESERSGKELETNIQDLGKDLEGAAQAKNDLEVLVNAANTDGDIPGAGRWDSLKPGFLESAADTEVLQAAKRVVQVIKKQTTGTAASDKEAADILASLGMGKGSSEQQFKIGLRQLVKNATDAMRAKEAKYKPGVSEAYQKRGGPGSAAMPKYDPDTTPAATPKGGRRVTMPDGTIWEEQADGTAKQVK